MDDYFAQCPRDFDQVGPAFAKEYYSRLQTDRNTVIELFHVRIPP